VADLFRPFVAGWDRAHAVWTRARGRSSSFDHAVRAWLRFDDTRADRMAAYMSYLGVLSLFPIIALAFAVGALLLANNRAVGDAFNNLLTQGLNSVVPGLATGTSNLVQNLQNGSQRRLQLQSGGVVTAIAGVAVLLYTGSGWVSAQREALRTIFGTDPRYNRFFLIAKAHDIAVLLLLGLLLVVSVAASVLTTTGPVKRLLGLGPVGNSQVGTLVIIATVLVGVLTGVALFLAQHVALAGVAHRRWRDYLPGAVVAAVGFEVLKQGAALLIQRVLGNPVYGAFGAIIAVLIWINLTSRVTLLGAAWTYTGWRGTSDAEVATATVLAATPGDAGSAVVLPDASAGAPGPAPDPALTPDTGRAPGTRHGRRGRPLTPVTSAVSVGLAVVATAAAVTGLLRVGRTRR